MAELAASENATIEEVDGATLEGGGQLLRVAVALGVGLGRDVRVKNIRAARSKPGLRPQHVASLRVAAAVGGVSVAGGVGAVEITVRGSQASNQEQDVFEADAGTAGSTTLMLQASLPVCLLRRPKETTKLRLKGGTNVPFSPGLDHARLEFGLGETARGVADHPFLFGELVVELEGVVPGERRHAGHVVSFGVVGSDGRLAAPLQGVAKLPSASCTDWMISAGGQGLDSEVEPGKRLWTSSGW